MHLSVRISVHLWLFLQKLRELFDFLARAFHLPAAFKISLPLRGQRERLGRILIERLRHQSDQIADDGGVVEQRFDD